MFLNESLRLVYDMLQIIYELFTYYYERLSDIYDFICVGLQSLYGLFRVIKSTLRIDTITLRVLLG